MNRSFFSKTKYMYMIGEGLKKLFRTPVPKLPPIVFSNQGLMAIGKQKPNLVVYSKWVYKTNLKNRNSKFINRIYHQWFTEWTMNTYFMGGSRGWDRDPPLPLENQVAICFFRNTGMDPTQDAIASRRSTTSCEIH